MVGLHSLLVTITLKMFVTVFYTSFAIQKEFVIISCHRNYLLDVESSIFQMAGWSAGKRQASVPEMEQALLCIGRCWRRGENSSSGVVDAVETNFSSGFAMASFPED